MRKVTISNNNIPKVRIPQWHPNAQAWDPERSGNLGPFRQYQNKLTQRSEIVRLAWELCIYQSVNFGPFRQYQNIEDKHSEEIRKSPRMCYCADNVLLCVFRSTLDQSTDKSLSMELVHTEAIKNVCLSLSVTVRPNNRHRTQGLYRYPDNLSRRGFFHK